MKEYFERRITYDPKTQNYKVSVPELGLEILADTEMSGIVEMRKEIEREAPRLAKQQLMPPPQWIAPEFSFSQIDQHPRHTRCGACGSSPMEQHHPRCPKLTIFGGGPPPRVSF